MDWLVFHGASIDGQPTVLHMEHLMFDKVPIDQIIPGPICKNVTYSGTANVMHVSANKIVSEGEYEAGHYSMHAFSAWTEEIDSTNVQVCYKSVINGQFTDPTHVSTFIASSP
jgi:hypothetical protein